MMTTEALASASNARRMVIESGMEATGASVQEELFKLHICSQ